MNIALPTRRLVIVVRADPVICGHSGEARNLAEAALLRGFDDVRIVTWPLGHPTHYAVVQLQEVVPQVTQPGQAPPLPKADPTKPVISVVMERDLGDLLQNGHGPRAAHTHDRPRAARGGRGRSDNGLRDVVH
jgi:hypothetical protein